jgi:hypothetical protein
MAYIDPVLAYYRDDCNQWLSMSNDDFVWTWEEETQQPDGEGHMRAVIRDSEAEVLRKLKDRKYTVAVTAAEPTTRALEKPSRTKPTKVSMQDLQATVLRATDSKRSGPVAITKAAESASPELDEADARADFWAWKKRLVQAPDYMTLSWEKKKRYLRDEECQGRQYSTGLKHRYAPFHSHLC